MPLAIIRQLPNHTPVLHGVVQESTDPAVDHQMQYMEETAIRRVEEFKEKFVEFKKATFYYHLIDKFDLNW